MKTPFKVPARFVVFAMALTAVPPPAAGQDVATIELEVLRDKIRGGWAAQTIGVTYGGPTEFQYNGTMIQDYEPIPWYDGYLRETYERSPGLYDDIYMDLTFVDVFDREGLDAPASAFANAFAHAEYSLWHANQMARYNILNGIMPPASGHWKNNPGADDIDFQIEADFAGLMSPGMPQAAASVCDTVGHIMNSGDGYYGGLFVATMYALAFVREDVEQIVTEALQAIPRESTFHQTIADVIGWYRAHPDDWKRTWFEIEKKWSEDVGCPHGVFHAFNIDARINAAYVVLGLLYGQGDFGKTLDIATRAGQDSDCNPATAGGILGTVLGYDGIPEYWKQGLADVEPLDFRYTTISLNDVYDMGFRHAMQQIERHGGEVRDGVAYIPVQEVVTAPVEQNFTGHFPIEERRLTPETDGVFRFTLDGVGFAVSGSARSLDGNDHEIEAELVIDGRVVEQVTLPTRFTTRRFIPFWRYQLDDGPHSVEIRLIEPQPAAVLDLDYVIVYGSERQSHTR